jgi:FMN reductase
MTRIAVVIGSATRPGRLYSAMTEAAERARSEGLAVDVLDLGQLHLDFVDGRPADDHSDGSQHAVEAVSNADAVLLASPVYRASFSGALKNLLDWLPIEALCGKPTGIVAMGASPHHYLGVERHLRDVLAWFGALTAPTSVYLTGADFEDGHLRDEPSRALDALLGTLAVLVPAVDGAALAPLPLAARFSRA